MKRQEIRVSAQESTTETAARAENAARQPVMYGLLNKVRYLAYYLQPTHGRELTLRLVDWSNKARHRRDLVDFAVGTRSKASSSEMSSSLTSMTCFFLAAAREDGRRARS
jgi:hypothetical protein